MTCVRTFFSLLFVFARMCSDSAFYVCSYLYVSMHVIMISMNNACAVVLFIQFQLLVLPPKQHYGGRSQGIWL